MDDQAPRTPGQLIEQLLAGKGWTKRVLAIVLGINETAVNKVVADKQAVTAELALALGDVFDESPERFLDLQKRYDLAKAQIAARPDPGRRTRARLFGDLPVSDMIKRGWLDAEDVRDVAKVEAALTKFFGVASTDEIEILPHAAKKTDVTTDVTPAQLAWIYRVKEITQEMIAARYMPGGAIEALRRLRLLLSAPEEARKVPRILTESGIRYVIVESLPSAKIDGVSFWLSDTQPVIGMSLRFDRIDNFWFVLRHEIEHILRRHGRGAAVLDTELEGEKAGAGPSVPDEERIANLAAADFCVPAKDMDRFIERKTPFFAERDILGFARTLKVHPGLVAGQLQNRTGRYDRFRPHLAKIRSIIIPNAISDGWGNVAPVGI
jgi:HTH-type transcriptional regulator / antitoxin HigA